MSDYVIIMETPRPRQQLSAVTLLRYQNQRWGLADGGAKPDWSRNAADGIQWKFGVSNITKHLERVHSMKLKECSVFDCCDKASKVSSLANAKDCRAKAVAPSFVSVKSSHRVCC